MTKRRAKPKAAPEDSFQVVWNGTQAKQGTAKVKLGSDLFRHSTSATESVFPTTAPWSPFGIEVRD